MLKKGKKAYSSPNLLGGHSRFLFDQKLQIDSELNPHKGSLTKPLFFRSPGCSAPGYSISDYGSVLKKSVFDKQLPDIFFSISAPLDTSLPVFL